MVEPNGMTLKQKHAINEKTKNASKRVYSAMIINQKNILPLCLLLAPLIALGMDLYTPSLPAIMNYFHVTHYGAKLTIILYLAGFGLSQPLVGIVSDHMERKNFILIALGCYVISSFLSALVPSIQWLYFLRIINSVCATSVAVVIKSIILDNFSGKMLAKANNYFTLSWSMTPMIAPVIGGYLQHYFNWQANFYFMAIYGLIGFVLCFELFKNQPQRLSTKKVLSLSRVFQKWKILFLDHFFVAAIFILAVENAILFLYYTAAPFIIQNTLHFNAAQYGNVMLFAGASYLVGNLINDRLLNYFSVEKLIGVGLLLSLVIPLIPILITSLIHHPMNIYLVTLPIFMIFMCDGLIFANLATKSLSSYKEFSGIAGGLLAGLFNVLAAVIVGVCAHMLDLHNIITLNETYFIMLCISCIVFFFCFKREAT